MNSETIIEQSKNTPQATGFTGFPLLPEVKTQISQELDALEKNPINGWDTVYTTFFAMLDTTIEELCNKFSCQKPGLIIRFKDRDSHQATAHLLTNGAAQLHVGAEFIRELLFAPAPADAKKMTQAFQWTNDSTLHVAS